MEVASAPPSPGLSLASTKRSLKLDATKGRYVALSGRDFPRFGAQRRDASGAKREDVIINSGIGEVKAHL
ncbi:MAG: hypothetical protein JWQ87_64 [Candidatus Sulfotelmatobacter sp.]|nr:hypothetical protein [Candidatus Sulfotelmatobacter sp.]